MPQWCQMKIHFSDFTILLTSTPIENRVKNRELLSWPFFDIKGDFAMKDCKIRKPIRLYAILLALALSMFSLPVLAVPLAPGVVFDDFEDNDDVRLDLLRRK